MHIEGTGKAARQPVLLPAVFERHCCIVVVLRHSSLVDAHPMAQRTLGCRQHWDEQEHCGHWDGTLNSKCEKPKWSRLQRYTHTTWPSIGHPEVASDITPLFATSTFTESVLTEVLGRSVWACIMTYTLTPSLPHCHNQIASVHCQHSHPNFPVLNPACQRPLWWRAIINMCATITHSQFSGSKSIYTRQRLKSSPLFILQMFSFPQPTCASKAFPAHLKSQ